MLACFLKLLRVLGKKDYLGKIYKQFSYCSVFWAGSSAWYVLHWQLAGTRAQRSQRWGLGFKRPVTLGESCSSGGQAPTTLTCVTAMKIPTGPVFIPNLNKKHATFHSLSLKQSLLSQPSFSFLFFSAQVSLAAFSLSLISAA